MISTEKVTQIITWKINGKGDSFEWDGSRWNTTKRGWPGAVLELRVEAIGQGRYVNCMVEVDGDIKDYMHRNDAGDCTVRYVID